MSKHLHFCYAISQIWSDVQNNCSLAKQVNLVMFVIVILSKLDSFLISFYCTCTRTISLYCNVTVYIIFTICFLLNFSSYEI